MNTPFYVSLELLCCCLSRRKLKIPASQNYANELANQHRSNRLTYVRAWSGTLHKHGRPGLLFVLLWHGISCTSDVEASLDLVLSVDPDSTLNI